jgi:hypothetical protein
MRTVIPLRSSPATYFAPVIVVVSVVAYLATYGGFGLSIPYWDAVLARASSGFYYALPLAAGVTAWIANRFSRSSVKRGPRPVRSWFRIVWAQTWPVFASVLLGYVVTVLYILNELGRLPAPTVPDLAMLLTFAAMAVAAVSFGYILGRFVYSAVAVPVAIFAMYQWIIYPQLDGDDVSWRNITGFSVYGCCDALNFVADPRGVLAPVLVAAGLLVALWLVVRYRWWKALVPAAIALTVALLASTAVAAGTEATPSALRSSADLSCQGDEPVVCLWPEQEASADGGNLTAELTKAYETARTAGFDLPDRIEPVSRAPLDGSRIQVDVASSAGDAVAAAFGLGVATSLSCSVPENEDPQAYQQAAGYALGVLAGADPDTSLPALYTFEDDGLTSRPMTQEEVRDYLGVADAAGAGALGRAWQTQQTDCRKGE